MDLHAGALVERPPGPKYTATLHFCELAFPGALPKASTLTRFGASLPKDFMTSLVVPSSCLRSAAGPLRFDADLEARFAWVVEAASALRLKALGVTLAIDDFGTGYSSLAYLRRFPVDTLKIDRSFVERLGALTDDTALADTIVQLGKSLGMATVAEGIEEFGQLAALREMGCHFAQGYYFSRPVPAGEAGALFLATELSAAER